MEKEDLIINLLRENRTDVKEVKEDISEIKVDVALNKDDLKVHMKRSDKIEELVLLKEKEVNNRISSIEKKLTVTYLLKLVVSVSAGVGAITGAVYGVLRLLD